MDAKEREQENQRIGAFRLWALTLQPGVYTLTADDCANIRAAGERLHRQKMAAQKAGSAKSNKKTRAAKRNAQAAGRPKKIK